MHDANHLIGMLLIIFDTSVFVAGLTSSHSARVQSITTQFTTVSFLFFSAYSGLIKSVVSVFYFHRQFNYLAKTVSPLISVGSFALSQILQ